MPELDPLLLSRIQFAFTISFHILFPTFTIGLAAWLVEQPSTTASGLITRLATELVVDIRALSVRINALEREIAQRMEKVAP